MRRGRFGRLKNNAEGSMAVLCAIFMIGAIGLASLAIDVGHLYTVRNELQNTTDAAVQAAARGLLVPDPSDNQKVLRDSGAATTAAMDIIQRESQLQGLTPVAAGARDDVTITFGEWNDKTSTWTALGSTVPATSPANAVEITIKRNDTTVYGPVTNFFAGAFGAGTTDMTISSRAYMGYAKAVPKGTVPVPLALPSSVFVASSGRSGWFARVFGPGEAVASSTKTFVFRDSGGYYLPGATPSNVNNNVTSANPLDPNQAYLFTVGENDSVPTTITNILEKIYLPNKTGSILFVNQLALGQQIYPRSEFMYPTSLTPIFQRLQKAYNYKTTGSATTAPPAGTPWRVTLAVYGTTPNPLVTQRLTDGFMSLARLLTPFWPSEAYACYTMPPPNIFVNGFVNADIIGVSYNASCDQCNYSFPKTIASPPPISGSTTYTSKKDCMARKSNSTWNANSMSIRNLTDASTIIPNSTTNPNVSGEAGGLSNQQINAGATAGVGGFAPVPKLIPR